MRLLTTEEIGVVSGGDFNADTFIDGAAYAMIGVGVAAIIPFIGAGALASAGLAASAAVLGVGGSIIMSLSTMGGSTTSEETSS